MPAGTLINLSVGAYRIVDFIGAGGMGEVYRAVHVSLGRVVALKVLAPLGADRNAQAAMERFRNEARIHAALAHPHIATLYDFLEIDGRPCIVMELVDGWTIEDRLRRSGPYAVAEALRLFERVVDAVGYLHNRGIVHRDIKSNNVKISSTGVVKLLDFGIAKSPTSPKLTTVGGVVGTMHYLSPEQLRGAATDPRSDIWALGVLLYEMVTGRMPFDAPGMTQIAEQIVRSSYRPASAVNQEVPPAVDAIIERCLKARPDDRYQSAEALLTDVRLRVAPAVTPRPPAARLDVQSLARDTGELFRSPSRRWMTGLGLAIAVLLLGWIFAPRGQDDGTPLAPQAKTTDSVQLTPGLPAQQPSISQQASVSLRTVTVDVFGGSAEVLRDDRTVGHTPYRFSAQLGDTVRLTLRREGFEDLRVDFTVNESRLVYTYTLSPRPLSQLDESIFRAFALPIWLVAPFRRLRRRRRSKGPVAPEITRTTGERDVLHSPDSGRVLAASVGLATDVGCVRDVNEDSVRVLHLATDHDPPAHALLAVVADGMGGHSAGEIASRLVVEVVSRAFLGNRSAQTMELDPHAHLGRALRSANAVVFAAAAQDRALNGMGTTCTALLVQDGSAYCAHVGDSRLYLVRDAEIFRMTEDHSAVMELVRRGEISPDDAARHPDKNVILRALGGRSDVNVTTWPRPFSVRHGDRFLLCTDGLSDLVTDAELLAAVVEHDSQPACDHLVSVARSRGGHDNISVAIVGLFENADAPEVRAEVAT